MRARGPAGPIAPLWQRGWPGSRWWRQPEQRERSGHARAAASGSALGEVAAVSISANRSERHLPEWGAVSGADGVGSPDGLGVSAERPAAASSSRINCLMEAAVRGSAAGASGFSASLISSGR